jgi:hypothetical protein
MLCSAIKTYYELFSDKPVCFNDLQKYISTLPEGPQSMAISKLREVAAGFSKEAVRLANRCITTILYISFSLVLRGQNSCSSVFMEIGIWMRLL